MLRRAAEAGALEEALGVAEEFVVEGARGEDLDVGAPAFNPADELGLDGDAQMEVEGAVFVLAPISLV